MFNNDTFIFKKRRYIVKLQISYDLTNLSQALEIAKKTTQFADIIEVGTPLLFAHGKEAVETFRKEFPQAIILADAKVVDRVSEVIPLFCKAGANYITVLYGTSNRVIQKAVSIAHDLGTKVVLDLIDPETMGQAAHDAETFGIDHLLYHYPHESGETYSHLDQWESVRGNTSLQIFVSGRITKKHFAEIKSLKPNGIVIGEAITKQEDPAKAAQTFKEQLKI
jgi:3-hexulose-6-phosphate synthase